MPLAFVVLASTVSVLAMATQAPAPADRQTAPPPPGTVTATGCLRAGSEPGTFELEHVRWTEPRTAKDPAAHHAPEQPRPPVAGQPVVAPPEPLRLAGSIERLKVRDYLGDTVTVTGMLAPQDPVVRPAVVLPDPQPTGDTTSREREREARTQTGPSVLNVRSITSVARTCGAK